MLARFSCRIWRSENKCWLCAVNVLEFFPSGAHLRGTCRPKRAESTGDTVNQFTFYSIILYFIIFLYLQQFRSSGDFLNRDTLVQIFTGYNAACWTLPSRFGRIHVFIFDWKRVLWERFTTACALCFCYESPWVFGCALSSRQTFLNQSGWLQLHPVRMPVLSKCSVRPCAQARPRKEFAAGHAVDMTVVTCCE